MNTLVRDRLGLGFGAWRLRVAGLFKRSESAAPRRAKAEASATAIPVRDWINVGSAQPARLLGFDQALVWVVVALLALGMVTEGEHGETSSAIQLADVLGGVLGIAAATAAFSTWHVEGGDRLLFALLFLAIGALSSLVLVAAQRIRT